MTPGDLSALLEPRRRDLERFVGRHAGVVARFEGIDDLVQGTMLRALDRAGAFEYRSDPELEAWMYRVARGHLADRRSYWMAEKRRPARLLRLTRPDATPSDPASAREPARDTDGPSTRAEQGDQLRLALEALELLLARDAELVRGHADGRTVEDEAERLGLSYAAAQRARLRALERYRRAYRLLLQR